MPAHHKSIIQEALERLDALMAIGESRGAAKAAARAAGEPRGDLPPAKSIVLKRARSTRSKSWPLSTGRGRRTRSNVWKISIGVQRNCRLPTCTSRSTPKKAPILFSPSAQHSVSSLPTAPWSPLFPFPSAPGRPSPARAAPKPTTPIFSRPTGSRSIRFLQATGLRRDELRCFKYAHLCAEETGVSILVPSGKGGKARTVPVLPACEEEVWALPERGKPEEIVFPRIPKHLNVHAYRRAYAQALYLRYAPGWALPPATGKLRPGDYHHEAAQRVTWALGHNRIDVVLRHYLC